METTTAETAWRCHARPAPGGKTCGHLNTDGIVFQRLVCCEACGCTKIASDARQSKEKA